MKVAEFMTQAARNGKGSQRDRTTYRAARRNIAKIGYRQAKRIKAMQKKLGVQ
jgi:hypothetical protein